MTVMCLGVPIHALAQSSVIIVNVPAVDLAYSGVTEQVYASSTNGGAASGTLTPINPANGALGTPIAITNLSGRLCTSDGGQYIFAALNGPTNHICQFDVASQEVVNAWSLGGTYVDDMAPVLGSPGAVVVSQQVLNRSPRFAGVVVYDNGVARSNAFSPFLGPTVIESSRTPGRIYGYDNETSPAGTYILKVDSSGISQIGGWGTLQGFYVDISWRAGWLFSTSGQIFDPDRGIQVGSFSDTPVTDDAASGRYYLVFAGAIIAYDQNTLLPVGAAALSGLTGAAGSLIRCGTNGFALRMNTTHVALIHTSLKSSGPPADLNLSLSSPPLPVPTGNLLTYTLTISNQGPNPARNVVLTQTLPANSSFVSALSTSGTNTPTSGGLMSSPLTIPSGEAVTVTVNLQTLKAGLLASVASITSDSLDPNLSNNVVQLEFPVGTPPVPNSVTELSLPTTDIAWDKVSGRIFASIPNADWLLGNSIAALDPAAGSFDARIATAIEPGKLAVSDNGQWLYAGIGIDNSIERINIATRALDIKFPTGFSGVADMAVMPGRPSTVVATAYNTLAVYDDGVMRPNTVGPGPYNFSYYLALTDTNTVAYEAAPNELRGIAINSSGATISSDTGLINSFDDQIKFAGGRLYTAGGRIIDPEALTVVTNLPFSGLVCPDAAGGKIFYLTTSGSTATLHAVNISTLAEMGNLNVSNVSGSVSSLIRWGEDGLAFRTTGNQVFLIRTILAYDANHDGMADAWEVANFGSLNVDPNADPDHDGMSNYAEFIAGTNPNNPDSVLRFTDVEPQGGGILLNWQGTTNVTYYLQRSENLGASAVWRDISTNRLSNSGIGAFTDLTASNSVNFYRIRVGSQ